jgi:hypothetical protein
MTIARAQQISLADTPYYRLGHALNIDINAAYH